MTCPRLLDVAHFRLPPPLAILTARKPAVEGKQVARKDADGPVLAAVSDRVWGTCGSRGMVESFAGTDLSRPSHEVVCEVTAYKEVGAVVEASVGAWLCRKVARLVLLGVVKG